jgi:hypothetical protein
MEMDKTISYTIPHVYSYHTKTKRQLGEQPVSFRQNYLISLGKWPGVPLRIQHVGQLRSGVGCEGDRNHFVVMILSIVQDVWVTVRWVEVEI